MNIIVKATDDLNISRKASGTVGFIFNDSDVEFEVIEDDSEDKTPKIMAKMLVIPKTSYPKNTLSDVIDGMSIVNLSQTSGPAVVETSLISNGLFVKEEVNPLVPADVKLAFKSTKNMIIGIVVLIIFVVNAAMAGPIAITLPAKSPLMRGLWRLESTLIFAYPLTLLLYVVKRKELSFKNDFSTKFLINSVIGGLFSFLWYAALVVGCAMTISSRAMVLNSSPGFYVFWFSIVTGAVVHKYEFMGYGLFIAGLTLMFTDPYAVKTEGNENLHLGDLIAFLGAGSMAILNAINSSNSKSLHPLVMMTQLLTTSMIYQTILCWFILGTNKVLSSDPDYGFFGWVNDSRTILYLLGFIGPFNGLTANLSFYVSFYYFPVEIIGGAILTQPFITQVVAVLLGQDEIPGFKTVLGLSIITIGTLTASYGSRLKAGKVVEKICEESLLMLSKISFSEMSKKDIPSEKA
jgi:hypothetical protein